MEARWHMEFTGDRHVVATIEQRDSAYYEAA
jgi:hypothetical protein